jgi:hypothetical protein|tara:strand:- start:350 stop:538 length:189 start_codon:yes stop_codon:yes gene_type:complete
MIIENEIKIVKKNYYGSDFYYPHNTLADFIREVGGGKTISLKTLQRAKELGYKVTLIAEELE